MNEFGGRVVHSSPIFRIFRLKMRVAVHCEASYFSNQCAGIKRPPNHFESEKGAKK